jgi:ketosteroid isomerase-like protein
VTPRDVVTGYFAALARHDTAAAVEFLDPEVVDEITSVGVLRGRDEVREFFDGLFAAIPDFEMSVVRTVRDRDTVAVQWRARGTFTGGPLYNGVQPTGTELQMRGCDVFDVRDDLIVANIAFADGLELARSIGMFPPQDSPAERAMIGAFNAATKVRGAVRDRFGPQGG